MRPEATDTAPQPPVWSAITVDNGRITTGARGRTGLQTVR